MRTLSTLIVALSVVMLSACGGVEGPAGYVVLAEEPQPQLDEERQPPALPADRITEKGFAKVEWNPEDAPSLFDAELEYLLDALPSSGEAENIPWPGAYWPTWQDSINNRWAGPSSESPAAKYGEAFGVANVEDRVSQYYGIDRYSSRPSCTSNSDCESAEGSCAIRTGEESGRCIPTWWGICHAWAPAAILEAEPIHPVTREGITFEVNDIKALVTLGYDKNYARGVSLRCNQDSSSDEIEYDAYGRPADPECVDTNPGTFHVVLTNYLGIRGESFVEDRTWDAEVWNQPMRGYRVASMDEITAAEANQLVGVSADNGSSMSFGDSLAAGAWHHEAKVEVLPGQSIEVEMSGDGDADLYVRFGAKPTAASYDCRPYLSHSDERCELVVPEGDSGLFVSVRGYTGVSSVSVSVTVRDSVEGDEYAFNALAERLYRVRTEVEYIFEPSVSVDGNLADRIDWYTGTDVYEYILEVDASGRVIGGEWLASSRQNHPDFLWLPVSRNPYARIANGAIKWSRIEELLAASVAPVGGQDGGHSVIDQQSGELSAGEWAHFGPYDVGSEALTALMTGSGDADLYVRRGAAPTTSEYDCRPYRADSNEQCEVAGPGSIFVSVRGYGASSFDLDVTYLAGGSDPGTGSADAGDDEHLLETGSLPHREWARYSLAVTAGQRILVSTNSTNDVDLYLRMADLPALQHYDARGFTSSGDESLDFTAPAAGTLHIGVHAWEAASFTMWTDDP
jgi:hypothetical protein